MTRIATTTIIRNVSRETDDTILHWLSLRSLGYQSRQIADYYRGPAARVRVATNDVLNADIAHCGEHVRAEYWS